MHLSAIWSRWWSLVKHPTVSIICFQVPIGWVVETKLQSRPSPRIRGTLTFASDMKQDLDFCWHGWGAVLSSLFEFCVHLGFHYERFSCCLELLTPPNDLQFGSKSYQNSSYVYPGARCGTLELVELIWFSDFCFTALASASSAFSSNASSTLLSEGDMWHWGVERAAGNKHINIKMTWRCLFFHVCTEGRLRKIYQATQKRCTNWMSNIRGFSWKAVYLLEN